MLNPLFLENDTFSSLEPFGMSPKSMYTGEISFSGQGGTKQYVLTLPEPPVKPLS